MLILVRSFFFFFVYRLKVHYWLDYMGENTVFLFIIKFAQQSSLHSQAVHQNFQRIHLSPESN